MCKPLDTRGFEPFAVRFQKQEILRSAFRNMGLNFLPSDFRHLRICFPLSETGGHSISLGPCPTKLPVIWDIWPDQPDVPVIQHGKRLSQEPHDTSRKLTKQLFVHDDSFGRNRRGQSFSH